MAQVQVGSGRVKAGLDAQRPISLGGQHQPLAEILFANDLRQALADVNKLFVDGHEKSISHGWTRIHTDKT